MCKCIQEIENRILEDEKSGEYKNPAVAVRLADRVWGNVATRSWGNKTISIVEITLENGSKELTSKVEHNFCPFCGENYMA